MFSRILLPMLGAGIVALGVAASAVPAQAATFAVINTNDTGAGSLRSAMLAARQQPTQDEIKFAIPGNGPHTITPVTTLPVITQPVAIRGYSQPGAAAATANDPAEPKIVIDAINVDRGFEIAGDGIEIRGIVIQRAQSTGIFVEGDENLVAGNFIGTDVSGTAALPNGGYGVDVMGRDNVIGGPDLAARNVISGNPVEVRVETGTGNEIQGNRIGTNAAGTAGLGANTGVLIETSGNVLRDNLISDELVGVAVWGDDNTLQGNSVGTNVDGSAALGNSYGIQVKGGDHNLIGGTTDGEGNVVSGNRLSGIRLEPGDDGPADDNDVQGNLIGVTSSSGVPAPMPNGTLFGFPGVAIVGSDRNTIGGQVAGAGNVIAANSGDGVSIETVDADDNRVVGNWIGTDESATLDLGNDKSGVHINGGDRNHVGDPLGPFPMNTIAHNDEDGVWVQTGTGNSIVHNAIHDNDDFGIDLGADGPAANDPLDVDAGANDLQNGPEITRATSTTVDWTLESVPGQHYRLEFYANDSCDRSGSGEGQTYLGAAAANTDANGNADGSMAATNPAGVGQHVSATATRVVFPLIGLRSTSEFSPCEEVR
jgi:parallel beta-helix repeat protein